MDGAEGLKQEGIFRGEAIRAPRPILRPHECRPCATVPGDAYEMQELRRLINEGGDAAALVQACTNLHSIAGMLKMFFRELTVPVISFDRYDDCIRCSAAMGAPSESTDTSELKAILSKLPPGCAAARALPLPPRTGMHPRVRACAGTSRFCAA